MVVGETVIEFPVPICPVVAQLPVNQYTVPDAPLAVNVVLWPLHIVEALTVIDVTSGGGGEVHVKAILNALFKLNP